MNPRLAAERLMNQRLLGSDVRRPETVVAWFGAVQAQEYHAAKWAIALRMASGVTDAAVERAFNSGRILRTHVLRPTWHFVAASDIHWMLDLSAPRIQRSLAYHDRLVGLDSATRKRGIRVIERGLRDVAHLTRAGLAAHLSRARIVSSGVPLGLLTMHAELDQVICSGPRRGKQLTYSLMATRAPRTKSFSRDEALGELARRFVQSHAPATLRDFAWWSGLTSAEAARGLEIGGCRSEVVDGLTYSMPRRSPGVGNQPVSLHLLPVFDEYLVAYRDLDAVPRGTGNRGSLSPAVLASGQVAGTWKAQATGRSIALDVVPARVLTAGERRALTAAVARYGSFLQKDVSVTIRR